MNRLPFLWESNPAALGPFIRLYGVRRAYWYLRSLGGSRFECIRAILFSI